MNNKNGILIGRIFLPINENSIEGYGYSKTKNKSYPVSLNLGGSISECEVYVYSSEGVYPHFHVIGKNGFETCIQIYCNRYYHHSKYRGVFDSKQCKELDSWLRLNNYADTSKTNWEYIAKSWWENNPDCIFNKKDIVTIQPDYRKIYPNK